MEYQVDVQYTEKIITEAVKRFWIKSCGVNTLIAIGCIAIFRFFMMVPDERKSS